MSAVGSVIYTVLLVYLLLLITRLVFDYVQMFARSWEPKGAMVVLLETVYTATDPPLKFFRRLIPPLRLGQVSLDLSFMVVLLLVSLGMSVATVL